MLVASAGSGRATPITVIIGTAGDRPDDTLRGIGRIAATRAQRVAIKETLNYLRGRTRESIVGELLAGIRSAGTAAGAAEVPVYETESAALRAELNGAGGAHSARTGARPDAPRVVVLMCHEQREAVFALLAELGARPIDLSSELTELIPRLQERPRR